MTSDPQTRVLDEKLKEQLRSVLSIGCDRQTACHVLGISAPELKLELCRDSEFRKSVFRAEASPELNHMRNLFNASKDEKNWRASVWWLERRAPERYARRAPNALSAAQLRQVIEELAETIAEEVKNVQDRRRLLDRLALITRKLRADLFEVGDESQEDAARGDDVIGEQILEGESRDK